MDPWHPCWCSKNCRPASFSWNTASPPTGSEATSGYSECCHKRKHLGVHAAVAGAYCSATMAKRKLGSHTKQEMRESATPFLPNPQPIDVGPRALDTYGHGDHTSLTMIWDACSCVWCVLRLSVELRIFVPERFLMEMETGVFLCFACTECSLTMLLRSVALFNVQVGNVSHIYSNTHVCRITKCEKYWSCKIWTKIFNQLHDDSAGDFVTRPLVSGKLPSSGSLSDRKLIAGRFDPMIQGRWRLPWPILIQ